MLKWNYNDKNKTSLEALRNTDVPAVITGVFGEKKRLMHKGNQIPPLL